MNAIKLIAGVVFGGWAFICFMGMVDIAYKSGQSQSADILRWTVGLVF